MDEPLEDKAYGLWERTVDILCCTHLQQTLFKALILVLKIENARNTS